MCKIPHHMGSWLLGSRVEIPRFYFLASDIPHTHCMPKSHWEDAMRCARLRVKGSKSVFYYNRLWLGDEACKASISLTGSLIQGRVVWFLFFFFFSNKEIPGSAVSICDFEIAVFASLLWGFIYLEHWLLWGENSTKKNCIPSIWNTKGPMYWQGASVLFGFGNVTYKELRLKRAEKCS